VRRQKERCTAKENLLNTIPEFAQIGSGVNVHIFIDDQNVAITAREKKKGGTKTHRRHTRNQKWREDIHVIELRPAVRLGRAHVGIT
jgi:hypothetical protein